MVLSYFLLLCIWTCDFFFLYFCSPFIFQLFIASTNCYLAKNYPTLQKVEPDNIKKYSNPNAATDRYYNQSVYEKKAQEGKKVGGEIQKIYSLTGKPIDKTDFKHNNMVPFFGAKVTGPQINSINDSQLDNKIGGGSLNIKRVEQASLFKPQENLEKIHKDSM